MKEYNGNISVTDKEYLTFCNALNLDWQFNPLNKIQEGKIQRPPKLHELLSPDKFVRKYDDGRKENVYKNISQMQNSAGILMNYLEECDAGSKEGDFLKQWEVGRAINN